MTMFGMVHGSAAGPRILVADADADTRTLYRESLGSVGCDVVEASDGREALVRAILHQPSLVITDLTLPFIDGYALCEVLRRDRTTAHVPILVVTTETLPAQIDRARHAGADVVLIKPAPIEIILNEIRRLVPREPITTTNAHSASQRDVSANRRGHSKCQRVLSKSFSRLATATPPASPPMLRCPSCDRLLTYRRSEIGGVNHRHLEQWDYYECSACGTFQHRQRTRKVRKLS